MARDRVRIVLVADRVPDELTRIVEFLDGQLRDVEVRAVEVSLYGAGPVSALVPRSTRPGSAASGARHVKPPPGLTALAAQAAPGPDGAGTGSGTDRPTQGCGHPQLVSRFTY